MLELIFRIIMCSLSILTAGYWIRFFVLYFRLKQYFWRFMPEGDNAVVNYMWHRHPLSADVPWAKKEKAFIQKRNEVLLKFDRKRAERFIAAERKICFAEFLFVILLWLVLFPCDVG